MRRLMTCLGPLVVLLCLGCDEERIDSTYGRATGPNADAVNGLAVLAGMFEQSGFDVRSERRLSPKLDQYDAIVWAPNDMVPPSREVRSALQDWLEFGPGRTLVYIGRDYDAVVDYWDQVRDQVPDNQRREAERRRAVARAEHDARRAAAPAQQYARWFTVRQDGRQTTIDESQLIGPWSEELESESLSIPVGVLLDVAEDDDVVTLPPEKSFDIFNEESRTEYDELVHELTLPEAEVLLGTESIPLVMRIQDESMRAMESQILVVVNGAFLLNLPLVQAVNRKLAGRLIEAVDEPLEEVGDVSPKVAFLESGPGGPNVLYEESQSQYPTGLQVFAVWPLGLIVVHLMGLGVVACFAMFPIFGRPRQPPSRRATHFAVHVQALGEMLAQSKDEATAREQIEHYHQTIRPAGREVLITAEESSEPKSESSIPDA